MLPDFSWEGKDTHLTTLDKASEADRGNDSTQLWLEISPPEIVG